MLGVIGGSGLHHIDGLERTWWMEVESPFGETSDRILVGEIGDQVVAFLPRHGRGHHIPPTEINFRANIDALKRLGVKDILSVSAVGSLREDLPPGTFVVVDQFIDRTFAREKSFFGRGLVAHVSMARPVCGRLGSHINVAAQKLSVDVKRGGTYLVMEGSQFSSLAESELYRGWGCDVIGMTNMPEAKLAREAEMCYATVAMVTDYDCWHPDHDDVSADNIVQVLSANADRARSLVREVAPLIGSDDQDRDCECRRALDYALLTAPESRDPAMIQKLSVVASRVLHLEERQQ